MVIAAIPGARIHTAPKRSGAPRPVHAGSDAASSGDREHDERARASRVLVPAGPSPSLGERLPPRLSTPFVAQYVAAHLGSLSQAERRISRTVEHVLPRADAAYRATTRLATDLEPGFLIARNV